MRLAFIGREFWVAEKLWIVIMSCRGHHESMLLLVCAMERRCRECRKKVDGGRGGGQGRLKFTRLLLLCAGFGNKQLERARVRSFQNKLHGPKTEDMLFVIIRWVRAI